MSDTLTVYPSREEAAGSEDEVRIASDSYLWSFMPRHFPRRVPLFVPRDQAYYWTREWQEGIRKSMTDLEAGNYTDYSPNDPDAITRRFLGKED